MTSPRILFLDIETAPNLAYVWGLYDQNISHEHLESSSYVLCWSAQWLGEKRILFDSIHRHHPKAMLRAIHRLLGQADIVIHYNGLKFDIPTLNKEFLRHGLTPPAPYRQVDMLQVCRRVFRFESNKLDAVLKSLGIGQKIKHRGFQLWVGCMNKDAACWREMERYNRHDVRSLVRLYERVRPWIDKHPNLGAYREYPACANCGGSHVQRRGEEVAAMQHYVRYQCQECGKWFRGEKIKKGG